MGSGYEEDIDDGDGEDEIEATTKPKEVQLRYPIHHAIAKGDPEEIKDYLAWLDDPELHLDINGLNEYHQTLLYVAIINQRTDVVEQLIQRGANVTFQYFQYAHANRWLEIARILEPNLSKDEYYQYWKIMQTRDNPEKLAELIANGVNINATTWLGTTPLYSAMCDNGKTSDFAKSLINHGADINPPAKDEGYLQMNGPSYWQSNHAPNGYIDVAVHNGWLDIVELLIDRGLSFDRPNKDGMTPLARALSIHEEAGDFREIAWLLVKKGCDLSHIDARGRSYLHLAAASGQVDLVEFFLKSGLDINGRDELGFTPLFYALIWPQKRSYEPLGYVGYKTHSEPSRMVIIDLLLAHDADINAQDNLGNSCLFFVCNHRQKLSMIRGLVKRGIDINLTNNQGRTALHYASQPSGARYLVGLGLNPNHRDNTGNTPLHNLSHSVNRIKTIETLISLGANIEAENAIGLKPRDVVRYTHWLGYQPFGRETEQALCEVLGREFRLQDRPPQDFLEHTPTDLFE